MVLQDLFLDHFEGLGKSTVANLPHRSEGMQFKSDVEYPKAPIKLVLRGMKFDPPSRKREKCNKNVHKILLVNPKP